MGRRSRSKRVLSCCAVAAVVAASTAASALGALPDGRAYELVSPAHKSGGVGSLNQVVVPRATPDGSHVFYGSIVPLPGSLNGLSNNYRSDRQLWGWTTVPLSPTVSSNQPSQALDTLGSRIAASADGQVVLFSGVQSLDPDDQDTDANGLSAADDLYLRDRDGSFHWVSRGEINSNDPNNRIPWGLLSADGEHVVFESAAPLLPADAARSGGTGVYDWHDGMLDLVAVGDDGALLSTSSVSIGNAVESSSRPQQIGLNTVSVDGSRIFFTVDGRLYVRIDEEHTQQVVPDGPGTQEFMSATPDGGRVFFTTTDALTADDTDLTTDLYRFDVSSEHLVRVSDGSNHQAHDAAVLPRVGARSSVDGERVFFAAAGALAPGAQAVDVNSATRNLYMVDHGVTRFVANIASNVSELVMPPACAGGESNWRVSADGSTVVFASTTPLTPDDTDARRDIYVYRVGDGGVVRASGVGAGGNGAVDAVLGSSGDTCAGQPASTESRSVSDDGRYVFFQTDEGVVSQDSNGRSDVYEYDSINNSLSLLSSGVSRDNSLYLDNGGSGADVFIATFESLVPQDIDGNLDVYDVRVGGGFVVPNVPPACQEDDCQGTAKGGEPGSPAASSADVRVPEATKPVVSPTLTLRRPSPSALRAARSTGRLRFMVRASVAGKVSLRVRVRGRRGGMPVGSRAVSVVGGQARSVSVLLSRAARRSLRRHRRLTLSVRAALTPGGVVKTLTVRLTMPKPTVAAARSIISSVDHR